MHTVFELARSRWIKFGSMSAIFIACCLFMLNTQAQQPYAIPIIPTSDSIPDSTSDSKSPPHATTTSSNDHFEQSEAEAAAVIETITIQELVPTAPVQLTAPAKQKAPIVIEEQVSTGDVVKLPLRQHAETHQNVSKPSTGMSMQAVKAQFGEPQAVAPGVGTPPITQWKYPTFSVYFEYDHVVHTVSHHNSRLNSIGTQSTGSSSKITSDTVTSSSGKPAAKTKQPPTLELDPSLFAPPTENEPDT